METPLTVKILPSLLNGTFVNPNAIDSELLNGKVLAISTNSKEILNNGIFVAIPGVVVDGHRFINEAFSNGAILGIVSDVASLNGNPGICVDTPRRALSQLANAFFGAPSETITTIGITGTNGKTTTTWFCYQLLKSLARGALRVGTIGVESSDGRIRDLSNLTTPDPITLHQLLANAKEFDLEYAIMEVSSHALSQFRVEDVDFDVAVFTNLTRDHLDYHPNMEDYFRAKLRLFTELCSTSGKSCVINTDDEYGKRILKELEGKSCKVISYGESEGANIRILDINQSTSGSRITFQLNGRAEEFCTPFVGRYNALNLAATLGVLSALGIDPISAKEFISAMAMVPGRLQRVSSREIGVFVDYSHTPDALLNALKAVREVTKGDVWVIFGCGGDRDKGKRPLMAQVAYEHSNHVIVTSDNPRSEDPTLIINDILSGGVTPSLVEPDREKAISWAISKAATGDAILIAGKGHEDYQIVGSTKFYFSDSQVAADAIKRHAR